MSIESVKNFLRSNGLEEVNIDEFQNEKVKVQIEANCYIVTFWGGSMYSDDLNIYWLVGVLTYYNLIERDYKSLNDNNK